jgi:hypothetical protein
MRPLGGWRRARRCTCRRALRSQDPDFKRDDACIRDKSICQAKCPSSFKDLPAPGSTGTLAELHTHALARWAARLLQRRSCCTAVEAAQPFTLPHTRSSCLPGGATTPRAAPPRHHLPPPATTTCHHHLPPLPRRHHPPPPATTCHLPPARRYYGYTSFAHGSLIQSLMRDRWHERLNLTECQMFATMYKDAVHPSDTGRLLLVRPGADACCTGARAALRWGAS